MRYRVITTREIVTEDSIDRVQKAFERDAICNMQPYVSNDDSGDHLIIEKVEYSKVSVYEL